MIGDSKRVLKQAKEWEKDHSQHMADAYAKYLDADMICEWDKQAKRQQQLVAGRLTNLAKIMEQRGATQSEMDRVFCGLLATVGADKHFCNPKKIVNDLQDLFLKYAW